MSKSTKDYTNHFNLANQHFKKSCSNLYYACGDAINGVGHFTGIVGNFLMTLITHQISFAILNIFQEGFSWQISQEFLNRQYGRLKFHDEVSNNIESFKSKCFELFGNPYIHFGLVISNIYISKKESFNECFKYGKAFLNDSFLASLELIKGVKELVTGSTLLIKDLLNKHDLNDSKEIGMINAKNIDPNINWVENFDTSILNPSLDGSFLNPSYETSCNGEVINSYL